MQRLPGFQHYNARPIFRSTKICHTAPSSYRHRLRAAQIDSDQKAPVDLQQVELQIRITKQKKQIAIDEEAYERAAVGAVFIELLVTELLKRRLWDQELRDRLETLELLYRSLQLDQEKEKRKRQIFVHRKHKYRAVIVGFDATCQATEHWISTMSVRKLSKGLDQPFFHCLVDSRDRPGAQTTYVAQENIMGDNGQPIEPVEREIQHPLLDRFFEGLDPDGASRYIPKERLRQQYPDV